ESLASVPTILRNGPEWFAGLGKENNGGTKVFSVSGHVNNPGNFEVPMGTPFKELLALAGGIRNGREFKALIPGGSSVPVLTAENALELTMDYDAISKAGSMLGSGAVIVMDDTADMVLVLQRISRFYYAESCGQCTPCREGTGWLYRMLTRIVEGKGMLEDLDRLDDVASKIEGRTICALGDAAAMPVRSFIRNFRPEFEHYIATGTSMLTTSKSVAA
ncbi:MAG: NADH-quinone oxidoreductase subunit F, partial [Gammaproteobacteria bacterium]